MALTNPILEHVYGKFRTCTLASLLPILLPLFLLSPGADASDEAGAAGDEFASQYRLDSGDHIRIEVYNEENLLREIVINDRGSISYPFIGDINVRGMTSSELESFITEELRGDYLVNPTVFVEITQYRPFYVNGEVEEPGEFPFQPGITVRKAVSIAGGLSDRGSERKIFVIREQNEEPARIGLDEQVRPGDIITVDQRFF